MPAYPTQIWGCKLGDRTIITNVLGMEYGMTNNSVRPPFEGCYSNCLYIPSQSLESRWTDGRTNHPIQGRFPLLNNYSRLIRLCPP